MTEQPSKFRCMSTALHDLFDIVCVDDLAEIPVNQMFTGIEQKCYCAEGMWHMIEKGGTVEEDIELLESLYDLRIKDRRKHRDNDAFGLVPQGQSGPESITHIEKYKGQYYVTRDVRDEAGPQVKEYVGDGASCLKYLCEELFRCTVPLFHVDVDIDDVETKAILLFSVDVDLGNRGNTQACEVYGHMIKDDEGVPLEYWPMYDQRMYTSAVMSIEQQYRSYICDIDFKYSDGKASHKSVFAKSLIDTWTDSFRTELGA